MVRAIALVSLLSCPLVAERPIVIAHRGASGYLPEHTLAAAALAYGQGADFIEQDVVLSKDKVPVVLHDVHIDTVTNVAKRYPGRARKDGRFYAIDFTLRELRRLRVTERFDPKTGRSAFPKRFPQRVSRFSIATLEECIQLVQGLNKSTGRNVGVYPEIKSPAWHREQGYDISPIVLATLRDLGYQEERARLFLQCFEQQELVRIRHELGTKLKLIQLIGSDNDQLTSARGLRQIAMYAQGIGPSLRSVVDAQGNITDLVRRAHDNGLEVHPYTFRRDALPKGFYSLDAVLEVCMTHGIDGLFTDFPDVCVHFLDRAQSK